MHQGLDHQRAAFFARRGGGRQSAQAVEIRALQFTAAPEGEQRTLRQCGQERARFADGVGLSAGQDTHERIVRQIGRIMAAPQPPTQPLLQPGVMRFIQLGSGMLRGLCG
ncbi:hypothetical protein G6F63_014298 [Rhizopus arrhizus]|nr:hypothetical protein G6F63_014298 [Rhizopus arrhizus]